MIDGDRLLTSEDGQRSCHNRWALYESICLRKIKITFWSECSLAYSVGGADRNVQWATHFVANRLMRTQSLSGCKPGWQLVRRVANSYGLSASYVEEILDIYLHYSTEFKKQTNIIVSWEGMNVFSTCPWRTSAPEHQWQYVFCASNVTEQESNVSPNDEVANRAYGRAPDLHSLWSSSNRHDRDRVGNGTNW